MPYKSEAQRKYFNANRAKLEAEGVDVDEWNQLSKGKKLTKKVKDKEANELNQNITLNQLKSVKSDSDVGDYSSKNYKLQQLVSKYPDQFIVDSDDGKYPGITHTPTGFRFHTTREMADSILSKRSSSKLVHYFKQAKSKAWQTSEGKSDAGGLNDKGRASLKAEGQNIQAPVTEDKPTGSRAKRRSSFCARSDGQRKMHNIDCSKDPDKRICKARRRWKCSSEILSKFSNYLKNNNG
jgi:hypothetical protein